MSGYVYFIRPVGLRGPVKIGFSNIPETRLVQLASWSPYPLELVVAISGSIQLELNIQECLARSRSHLEWFHATDEVTGLVEKLKSGTPIEDALNLSVRHGVCRTRRGPGRKYSKFIPPHSEGMSA